MTQDCPPTFTGIPCRGCFYCRGGCAIVNSLSKGEPVLVEREPHNRADGNAIRVCHESGTHFGYIDPRYAAKIAPWMDKGWVFLGWKTGRVMCSTIVTLEPFKSAPAKEKAETRITQIEPMDRPLFEATEGDLFRVTITTPWYKEFLK